MTLLVYEGPPDSFDSEVGHALALAREGRTVELPDDRQGAEEGATITATDVDEASGFLEPGRVYDLPPRLAKARLETSAWWSRVTKLDELSEEQLHRLARDRGVKGRTKLKGKELVKAIREASPATLPDPSPVDEGAPAGGDASPTPGSTAATGGPGPETGAGPTAADAAAAAGATATTTGGNNP